MYIARVSEVGRLFHAEHDLKSIRVQLTPPEVARRRKILLNTFLHTSKSHSAAHGMQAYSARELRANMQVVTSALLLFTLHFSFVVVKPIQSKQVEVSVLHLASYLCLHHTRLPVYYFSTYCTHENSMMAFMTTL